MTIKLADAFFHHHDYFHCLAKHEKHLHKHYKKCPIPSFELSIFSLKKQLQTKQKHIYYVEYIDNYRFKYYFKKLEYTFLLRAPPILNIKVI